MIYLKTCVYKPPTQGFPHLAIVFRPDGEILAARVSPSPTAAEEFVAKITAQFQAEIRRKEIKPKGFEDRSALPM